MSKANRDYPLCPPSKNAKGFSAALLLGLSPMQNSLFEMSDGVLENQKLNTSASAVQGDTSSMMNDFITADLMQKIEQLSPISPNQQIKTRMSDVIMINCEDNNNSSRSSANSGLYASSDSSEELELKEDEITKKRNKKGGKNTNNNNNEDKAPFGFVKDNVNMNINSSDIGNNVQQQNMIMHNKMKNFEKKFNKSFCAGDKGSNNHNSSRDNNNINNEQGLFNQHSHSIGGFSSNNNNNKSQVYSYYDSTSRYLSQVLQGEEIEKNESKACDSLNNSNNYIPKNFLGLGNNANLSGSNSTTSYNIEPFNKSDKDRNSNSIFDNINANNIHEFTANQYSSQFQHQLNNQFDSWINNNTNNNNNLRTSNSNSNNSNKDNNNDINKVILQNIKHQQRTPVTAVSNTSGNNNNNSNGGTVENNVFNNPFIFESRPPLQTLPPPLSPFPNTNAFGNALALAAGNNLMNYFAQMQMIQQKNYIEYTNALNHNNNTPTSNNPFPRRKEVNSSSSLNNITNDNVDSSSMTNNNNDNHKEGNVQQQHIPSKKGKHKDEPKEYLLEMFGRIGWICNKCNNFNYETRNRCNRCSADKDPKKLSEIHKKNKEKDESSQSKKKNKEQKADWVCPNCSNLNFGFRKICNRCQIPKVQTKQPIK